MPQSSIWEIVQKILCQVFSPVATKMCAATRICSRPQVVNETLQEYIQGFTDFVIQTKGTYPTAVTCQVTIVLFIRHVFDKEMRKLVAGAKTILTLRHAITLAQEAETKLKKYKGLNNEDSTVMQASAI